MYNYTYYIVLHHYVHINFVNKYICTLFVDTISFVFVYPTIETIITEQPHEMDHPLDGSLYVIQETIESQFIRLWLFCYNLESDSDDDTEITVTNTNQDISIFKTPNAVRLRTRQFPPSINGNITCRSKATGKKSTIFVASK